MRIIILFFCLFFFAATGFSQNENLQLRIFKIKHIGGESLFDSVNDLKSSEGKVSFDPNTNSLIVLDHLLNLQRISSVIDMLDVEAKQVEIKVLIIETTDKVLENIGITSGQMIIPKESFKATVHLLETSKDTEVRSSMVVRTLSGQPAMIQIASDEFIGNESVVLSDGKVLLQPIRERVGNSLEVLPSVNPDGKIRITLRPSTSSLEENGAPSQRTILTQVVVPDGDTVALGGVNSEEGKSVEEQGFGMTLSKKSLSIGKKAVMFLTAKITD